MNKLNEAKVSLEKSINLDPNFFQAYYNLGIILKKLRKTEESIEVFKSGLNIKPNFIPLLWNNFRMIYGSYRLYIKFNVLIETK